MMLRTGLIVDANNLYFSIQSVHRSRRVRYEEYVKHLESLGHTLTFKIMFSRQKAEPSQAFMHTLKLQKFELHFGNISWDISMALRAADIVPYVDCLVIGSNNQDAAQILSWAKERGKIVKCFAYNIPPFFSELGECIEITENLLDGAKVETKALEDKVGV